MIHIATGAEYAKRILNHYFGILYEKVGLPWDEDNQAEMNLAVDSIVEEIRKEVTK